MTNPIDTNDCRKMMTDADIQRLRELCKGVTQPLPWVAVVQDGVATVLDDAGMWVAEFGAAPDDAAYGAEAANLAPELLDEIECLRGMLRVCEEQNEALGDVNVALVENERLRAALAEACDIADDFILGRFMSTARTRDDGDRRIAELRKAGGK